MKKRLFGLFLLILISGPTYINFYEHIEICGAFCNFVRSEHALGANMSIDTVEYIESESGNVRTENLDNNEISDNPNNNDFYLDEKDEIIKKEYSFFYEFLDVKENKRVDIEIEIPEDLYFFYLKQNHEFSEDYGNINSFITDNDPVIRSLADKIKKLSEKGGFSSVELLRQLIGEIEYVDDINGANGLYEYPKYPIETLVDGTGDCEDTVFLIASLFKAMNISSALVRFDDHIGIALFISRNDYDLIVSRYGEDFLWDINSQLGESSKSRLVYLETTGNAEWDFGDMPENLRGREYEIYSLNEGEELKYYESFDDDENINKIIKTEEAAIKADENLLKMVNGRILLQVEESGEGWYVYPDNRKKYYLGRPADAFRIMRELGLGISESDFILFNGYAPERLSGKILLRAEADGEAYYINPDNLKMYYLGKPSDAFDIMKGLGLGITNDDIKNIETGK